MDDREFDLSEEILRRYFDKELSREECAAVESRLAAAPGARGRLEELRRFSALMGLLGTDSEPDELTAARNWEAIARSLPPARKPLTRRAIYWLSLAAAAVLLVFTLQPRTGKASSGLVVESIDCSYSSFMLLRPQNDNGHTIIWVNDSGGSPN